MQSVGLQHGLQNVNCTSLGWGTQDKIATGLGATGDAMNSLVEISLPRGVVEVKMPL